MTCVTSGGGPAGAPRALAATRFQPSLDRSRLCEAIAVRRQHLAEREADLVAACERAVAHGAGRHVRVDERATWDRAAWNRYVAAATQLEPQYMPQMLRLIRDIERLERLAALPASPQASVGRATTPQNGRHEEVRVEARSLRTVICPLGLMRGLNRPPSRS
jgi:hypothetical protein